ncbi:CCL20 protein, partial [Corythaeola cristata]|nr:CCL20 protein [Corythaeola cristata]
SKSLVLVCLLGLLALLLCGTTEAQSNQDCCLSFFLVRLPRWALKGYIFFLSSEVCDIHAIIF